MDDYEYDTDSDTSSTIEDSANNFVNATRLADPIEVTEDLTTQTNRKNGDKAGNFSSDDVAGPKNGTTLQEKPLVQARAYQLEMFEESLKRNIIVAVC